MGEAELVEIESRIEHYPPQARHDILRLTGELRRTAEARGGKRAKHAGSPLYDTATGLLNAGAYGVRFAMARARATRFRKIFAVMSVDVDVSAARPPARDEAVREVAALLEGCVRATDTLARIGPAAFAIILEDLVQPEHAERVKRNVEDTLAGPTRPSGGGKAAPTEVRLRFYPGPDPDAPMTYQS